MGLFTGLIGGLGLGLISGLFVMAVGVLPSGLSRGQVNEQDYQTPSEGILRSARIDAVTVLVFMLVAGPLGVMVGGLGSGLLIGLSVGLAVGLLVGVLFGGDATLNHYTLRWVLLRAGLVPPHLVRFLNYAADHVLLQRIGGAYRFVHGLLLEYFADLSQQEAGGSDKRSGAA
jgi:hypothetical protein